MRRTILLLVGLSLLVMAGVAGMRELGSSLPDAGEDSATACDENLASVMRLLSTGQRKAAQDAMGEEAYCYSNAEYFNGEPSVDRQREYVESQQ